MHLWVEECSGCDVLQGSAELLQHEVTDAVIWCFTNSRGCSPRWVDGS